MCSGTLADIGYEIDNNFYHSFSPHSLSPQHFLRYKDTLRRPDCAVFTFIIRRRISQLTTTSTYQSSCLWLHMLHHQWWVNHRIQQVSEKWFTFPSLHSLSLLNSFWNLDSHLTSFTEILEHFKVVVNVIKISCCKTPW